MSHHLPTIFPRFPNICPSFSQDFPMTFPHFSRFPADFPRFSPGFPASFPHLGQAPEGAAHLRLAGIAGKAQDLSAVEKTSKGSYWLLQLWPSIDYNWGYTFFIKWDYKYLKVVKENGIFTIDTPIDMPQYFKESHILGIPYVRKWNISQHLPNNHPNVGKNTTYLPT